MTDKTTAEREALMRLADAYADASFTQGLERKTITPEPEVARSALDAALRGALAGRASVPLPGAQEAVREPLHITHGPLMRHAAALLRLRKPVTPDVESVAAELELAVDGHATPSGTPSQEWLDVAEQAMREVAAPQPALSAGWVMVPEALPLNGPLRDALIDWITRATKGECYLYSDMWAALMRAAALPASPTIEGESK